MKQDNLWIRLQVFVSTAKKDRIIIRSVKFVSSQTQHAPEQCTLILVWVNANIVKLDTFMTKLCSNVDLIVQSINFLITKKNYVS